MKEKLFIIDELENHIPTFVVKAILDAAGTYDLWRFADQYCSSKNFEMIAPLIVAYSSAKINEITTKNKPCKTRVARNCKFKSVSSTISRNADARVNK